jgi:hypothetical protein
LPIQRVRVAERPRFHYAIAVLLLALSLAGVTVTLFAGKSMSILPAHSTTRRGVSAGTQAANYEIIRTSDGFTSVRSIPTTKSSEVGRLYPGTKIACQATVKGETLWGVDEWRHCPNAGGYIHSRLLMRAGE